MLTMRFPATGEFGILTWFLLSGDFELLMEINKVDNFDILLNNLPNMNILKVKFYRMETVLYSFP